MRTSRSITLAAMLIASAALAACSRERQDWQSAEAADTVEAYGEFLGKHPEGELAAKARQRRDQLAEERDWQKTGSADTLEAYQGFLSRHPQGKWADEARIRIESFSVAESPPGPAATPGNAPEATPEAAAPKARPAGVQAAPARRGVTKAPAAHEASESPGPVSTGVGAQLGAFSDEAKARSEWQRLTRRFPRELDGLTPRFVSAQTGAGRVVRLQVGVADEAHARSLCAALKTAGQGCMVVLQAHR